jgi:hypothetical protein
MNSLKQQLVNQCAMIWFTKTHGGQDNGDSKSSDILIQQ